MDIRLIGPIRVYENGTAIAFKGPVHQLALAILVSNNGRAVTAEQLIDRLWPYDELVREPRKGLRARLHEIVSDIRRALRDACGDGHAYLPDHNGGYHFVIERDRVDLLRYLDRRAQAREELDAGALEQAVTRFRDALREWGDVRIGRPDEALAGVPGEWAQFERDRLHTYYLLDRIDCVDTELRLGRHHRAVPELVGLTALEPCNERLACLLMLAYYRSGQTNLAQRTFTEISARLRTELGTLPCEDLNDLDRRIREQDPDLRLTSTGLIDLTTTASNPPAKNGEPMTTNNFTNNANAGSTVWSMASNVEGGVFVNGTPTTSASLAARAEELRTSLRDAVKKHGVSADTAAEAESLLDAALQARTRTPVPDHPRFVSALEQVKQLFDPADLIADQVDQLLAVSGSAR
jgi:DNA-binding SARP family transcriptional activator